MFQLGQRIRILEVPDHDVWNIPRNLIGVSAVVIECSRDTYEGIPCFRVKICEPHSSENGTDWYFPSPDAVGYALFYEATPTNRWNPMNYVSPFEPLNLP